MGTGSCSSLAHNTISDSNIISLENMYQPSRQNFYAMLRMSCIWFIYIKIAAKQYIYNEKATAQHDWMV